MNTTLNKSRFIIPCGLKCKKIVTWIHMLLVVIVVIFWIYIKIRFVKRIIRRLLKCYKTQDIQAILVKGKKTEIIIHETNILKQKRRCYKITWILSFVYTFWCIVLWIGLFPILYDINISFWFGFIGVIGLVLVYIMRDSFEPYFKGFNICITSRLEFLKVYDIRNKTGKVIYENQVFLKIGYQTLRWSPDEHGKEWEMSIKDFENYFYVTQANI